MITEKNLPPINTIEATRYIAGKIAEDALYHQKGYRHVDFMRPTASAERKRISTLSLSEIGEAALFQRSLDDTSVHIDNLS